MANKTAAAKNILDLFSNTVPGKGKVSFKVKAPDGTPVMLSAEGIPTKADGTADFSAKAVAPHVKAAEKVTVSVKVDANTPLARSYSKSVAGTDAAPYVADYGSDGKSSKAKGDKSDLPAAVADRTTPHLPEPSANGSK